MNGDGAVELTKFRPETITSGNKLILISGARGSGKTILMKDLLYHYHRAGFPRCVVFSQTESASGFFGSVIPGINVYSPTRIEDVQRVYDAQKELFTRRELGQLRSDIDLRLVFVLDDLAFDEKMMNSKLLKEIAMNGRHYKITLMLSVQYLLSLKPSLRSNVDQFFVFADTSRKNRERIYETFCGFIDNFADFNKLFTSTTKDYMAMVVNCRDRTGVLTETVSFHKANPMLSFRFGSPAAWAYSEKHFLSPQERFLRDQRQKKQKGGRDFIILNR